jgi:hypothetical protein
MLANCDRCELRDIACAQCVITVLPDGQAGIGEAERRALRVLAEAGLVPPLRFCAGPACAAPAGPRRAADPGHFRDTRPMFPTRLRIENVKTGPRVGEAVETALALH